MNNNLYSKYFKHLKQKKCSCFLCFVFFCLLFAFVGPTRTTDASSQGPALDIIEFVRMSKHSVAFAMTS